MPSPFTRLWCPPDAEEVDSQSVATLESESSVDDKNGVEGILDAYFYAPSHGEEGSLDDRRESRVHRPGAILLPNLDIDNPALRPRERRHYASCDGRNETIDHGDDEEEMNLLVVASNARKGLAHKVVLRLREPDRRRINLFEVDGGDSPFRDRATLSIGRSVGSGGNDGSHETTECVVHEVPEGGYEDEPEQVTWIRRFLVEATTLPGDRKWTGPQRLAPPPPGAESEPRADEEGGLEVGAAFNLDDLDEPIYPEDVRHELGGTEAAPSGEVWFQLIHYDEDGDEIRHMRDVGVFTIAPWLMSWNTKTCRRVYVTYNHCDPARTLDPGDIERKILAETHPFVWDLLAACDAAGLRNEVGSGPRTNRDSSERIAPSDSASLTNPDRVRVFVLDGRRFDHDKWLQDQMIFGHCIAPYKSLALAVSCNRGDHDEGAGMLLNHEFCHAGLGVFNRIRTTGLSDHSASSRDYGGNVEVSPPIYDATDAIDLDPSGGPAIPDHPEAHLGKIIVGDSTGGRITEPLRRFLLAQSIQPVVPIDTSWLCVQHVDEILSFVAAPDRKRWRMLFADVTTMQDILARVVQRVPLATMHAGRYRRQAQNNWPYAEVFVQDWLEAEVNDYNRDIQRDHLTPILLRLLTALHMAAEDVLPIPCFFKDEGGAVAKGPGMVNLQVVNGHLMVPRPFGPRVSTDDAHAILGPVLQQVYQGARGVDHPPRTARNLDAVPAVVLPEAGTWYWARPGETLDLIAMASVSVLVEGELSVEHKRQAWRDHVFARIQAGGAIGDLPQSYRERINARKEAIRLHERNTDAVDRRNLAANMDAGRFTRWMRLWVPDDRVDVLEAYALSCMGPLGNTVHFIDAFECLHEAKGEVHCATNALRDPPDDEDWWDEGRYFPERDLSYTT